MEAQDIQEVLKLLNAQRETIARMDERSLATAETIKRMEGDISDLKKDSSGVRAELQEVKNTAFRNAVIVGFIGAGLGAALGSIATILLRSVFGG